MAEAVNARPLTTEARVQSWNSPYEVYDGRSDTMTGFSPSTSVFPVSTIPPMLQYSVHLRGQKDEVWER